MGPLHPSFHFLPHLTLTLPGLTNYSGHMTATKGSFGNGTNNPENNHTKAGIQCFLSVPWVITKNKLNYHSSTKVQKFQKLNILWTKHRVCFFFVFFLHLQSSQLVLKQSPHSSQVIAWKKKNYIAFHKSFVWLVYSVERS